MAVTLTACVPLPHFVNTTPRLSGRVSKSGHPLADAVVFFGSGREASTCKADAAAVKTAKDGDFFLARETAFSFFYVPMVEPISVNAWQLCIDYGGQTFLGDQGLNALANKQNIVLLCDIDKPYNALNEAAEVVRQVCKVVESTRN